LCLQGDDHLCLRAVLVVLEFLALLPEVLLRRVEERVNRVRTPQQRVRTVLQRVRLPTAPAPYPPASSESIRHVPRNAGIRHDPPDHALPKALPR
jgi:hypothetical protein